MSVTFKRYLISTLRVFLAAVLGAIVLALNAEIPLDKAGLIGLATSVFSTAIKAVIEYLAKSIAVTDTMDN